MQIVKINQPDEKISLRKAHEIANEKANSILGECMNIAYSDDEQKLVSPTLIACLGTQKDDCGVDSYAKSLDAELEVDVNVNYRFFYRHVEDHATPSPSIHGTDDPSTLMPYW